VLEDDRIGYPSSPTYTYPSVQERNILSTLYSTDSSSERVKTAPHRPYVFSAVPWNEVVLRIKRADERFAAKEAAYKAFQPDRKVSWKDLEVWKHKCGITLLNT
jgi:hypothetical protein